MSRGLVGDGGVAMTDSVVVMKVSSSCQRVLKSTYLVCRQWSKESAIEARDQSPTWIKYLSLYLAGDVLTAREERSVPCV